MTNEMLWNTTIYFILNVLQIFNQYYGRGYTEFTMFLHLTVRPSASPSACAHVFNCGGHDAYAISQAHMGILILTFIHKFLIFQVLHINVIHYNNVIMSAMASQITSLTIVYSTVYSGEDQRKYQSSASLVYVWGIHRWPMNSRTNGQ